MPFDYILLLDLRYKFCTNVFVLSPFHRYEGDDPYGRFRATAARMSFFVGLTPPPPPSSAALGSAGSEAIVKATLRPSDVPWIADFAEALSDPFEDALSPLGAAASSSTTELALKEAAGVERDADPAAATLVDAPMPLRLVLSELCWELAIARPTLILLPDAAGLGERVTVSAVELALRSVHSRTARDPTSEWRWGSPFSFALVAPRVTVGSLNCAAAESVAVRVGDDGADGDGGGGGYGRSGGDGGGGGLRSRSRARANALEEGGAAALVQRQRGGKCVVDSLRMLVTADAVHVLWLLLDATIETVDARNARAVKRRKRRAAARRDPYKAYAPPSGAGAAESLGASAQRLHARLAAERGAIGAHRERLGGQMFKGCFRGSVALPALRDEAARTLRLPTPAPSSTGGDAAAVRLGNAMVRERILVRVGAGGDKAGATGFGKAKSDLFRFEGREATAVATVAIVPKFHRRGRSLGASLLAQTATTGRGGARGAQSLQLDDAMLARHDPRTRRTDSEVAFGVETLSQLASAAEGAVGEEEQTDAFGFARDVMTPAHRHRRRLSSGIDGYLSEPGSPSTPALDRWMLSLDLDASPRTREVTLVDESKLRSQSGRRDSNASGAIAAHTRTGAYAFFFYVCVSSLTLAHSHPNALHFSQGVGE